MVQEFNKGVYDYIIATDEGGNRHDDEESGDSGTESEEGDEEDCVSLCISMCSPHSFLISHAFFSSAWYRDRQGSWPQPTKAQVSPDTTTHQRNERHAQNAGHAKGCGPILHR